MDASYCIADQNFIDYLRDYWNFGLSLLDSREWSSTVLYNLSITEDPTVKITYIESSEKHRIIKMHLSHLSFMKMVTPIEIQGIQTILVSNKESGSNV